MSYYVDYYALVTFGKIALVTELLEMCWNHSGNELSELSHRFAGWRLAGDKETIPYEVALVGTGHLLLLKSSTASS